MNGSSSLASAVEEANELLEREHIPLEANAAIDQVCLHLVNATSPPPDSNRLLANIKRILSTNREEADVDYRIILELLNSLISLCPFDDVLTVYSVTDLEDALNSDMSPLIKAACKVISKSAPKGIFATSVLIDILLKLLFDSNTDISIINEIESTIAQLATDELIRRRILVNNRPLLLKVKKSIEPLTFARLLELLYTLFENMAQVEFDSKLYTFSSKDLFKAIESDIILFISITTYYTRLFNSNNVISISSDQSHWILRHITPIISTYGEIFTKLDEFIDIKLFAKAPLFKLFESLSYLEDDGLFRDLDTNFIHISNLTEDSGDFLSFVNPDYLARYHSDVLLRKSVVKPSNIGVLRNLVASSTCFEVIKENIKSTDILQMPYLEQMALIQKLSQYVHSASYTVQNMPKVMSNLIDHNNIRIIETEVAELRRETIERFLQHGSQVLNVWYLPLKTEYARITYTSLQAKEPSAEVATVYL